MCGSKCLWFILRYYCDVCVKEPQINCEIHQSVWARGQSVNWVSLEYERKCYLNEHFYAQSQVCTVLQCCCYYHQFYCSVPYIECPCMYNQLICLFLLQYFYSPCFFIWLSHSHFILYKTFSKLLYSSILVQLAMFLLVTSLLIFNHLLLQIFLCIFVLPLNSVTN